MVLVLQLQHLPISAHNIAFARALESLSINHFFTLLVDIGIATSTSPALDIAALCLDSWPAAIFTQGPPHTPVSSYMSANSRLTILQ